MRVFVLTTGRSGSMTFAKACGHLSNFTAAHESNKAVAAGRLDYPDNHIEVDNRLSWFLGSLHERYPDARYVHLTRDPAAVARSYLDRWRYHPPSLDRGIVSQLRRRWRPTFLRGGILPAFAYGILLKREAWPRQHHATVAALMVETINANIREFLRDKPHRMVRLEHVRDDFAAFLDWIDAEGETDAALAEWGTMHNAT